MRFCGLDSRRSRRSLALVARSAPPSPSVDRRCWMVKGLELDEFSRGKMNNTLKELEEERAGVAHLLK